MSRMVMYLRSLSTLPATYRGFCSEQRRSAETHGQCNGWISPSALRGTAGTGWLADKLEIPGASILAAEPLRADLDASRSRREQAENQKAAIRESGQSKIR